MYTVAWYGVVSTLNYRNTLCTCRPGVASSCMGVNSGFLAENPCYTYKRVSTNHSSPLQ